MDAILWSRTMLLHQKEAQEFRICLQLIEPIMTDQSVSRDEKRSTLNMMVIELSDKAFNLKPIAQQIMTIINMKREVCQEYIDSETQVEGILGWLPRFKKHRDLLLQEVKRNRKECGLKI